MAKRHANVFPLQPGAKSRLETRILIADDNGISAEMMALMVHRLGLQTDLAATGLEAVQRVEAAANSQRPYALVLMDLYMPVMDGLEATRRLRAAGHSAESLPVVLVSAANSPDEIRSGLIAGMQAYLVKPITLTGLTHILDAWGPTRRTVDPQNQVWPNPSLRIRFEERKLATLSRIEQALRKNAPIDAAMIADLRDMLHKLAGVAGSFGEEGLSIAAAQCEAELIALGGGDVRPALAEARDRLRAITP